MFGRNNLNLIQAGRIHFLIGIRWNLWPQACPRPLTFLISLRLSVMYSGVSMSLYSSCSNHHVGHIDLIFPNLNLERFLILPIKGQKSIRYQNDCILPILPKSSSIRIVARTSSVSAGPQAFEAVPYSF